MTETNPPAVWWSPSLNTVISRGDHNHVYLDKHFALPDDAVRLVPDVAARGSAIESWLREVRDKAPSGTPAWDALHWALNDYQLHADSGVPLGEEIQGGSSG